jgi:nucleotide-binding universal stress UspA family protein
MFKTIVLALDGSDGARKAIPVAAELAEKEKARLVIAHVVEFLIGKGTKVPEHIDEDEIRAEIDGQASELSSRGIETEVKVVDNVLGGPARGIVEIADSVGGDLIVTGTRGHSGLVGAMAGSVVQRLLHIAKRPVLAVPE